MFYRFTLSILQSLLLPRRVITIAMETTFTPTASSLDSPSTEHGPPTLPLLCAISLPSVRCASVYPLFGLFLSRYKSAGYSMVLHKECHKVFLNSQRNTQVFNLKSLWRSFFPLILCSVVQAYWFWLYENQRHILSVTIDCVIWHSLAVCEDAEGYRPSDVVNFIDVNSSNYNISTMWIDSIYANISENTSQVVTFLVGRDNCTQGESLVYFRKCLNLEQNLQNYIYYPDETI